MNQKKLEAIAKRMIGRKLFPVPVPDDWKKRLGAVIKGAKADDTMLDVVERFCAQYRWSSEAHEAFVKRLGLKDC